MLTAQADLHVPLWEPREFEARLIADLLRLSRVSVLYGALGAGKTTLLRQGVLPLLSRRADDSKLSARKEARVVIPFPDRRRKGPASQNASEIAIFFDDWNENPLQALHAVTLAALPFAQMRPAIPAEAFASCLKAWCNALSLRFFFIFDRFEQYLYAPSSDPSIREFLDKWVQILAEPLPVNVLISVQDQAKPLLDLFRSRIPRFDDASFTLPPYQTAPTPLSDGRLPAHTRIAAAPARAGAAMATALRAAPDSGAALTTAAAIAARKLALWAPSHKVSAPAAPEPVEAAPSQAEDVPAHAPAHTDRNDPAPGTSDIQTSQPEESVRDAHQEITSASETSDTSAHTTTPAESAVAESPEADTERIDLAPHIDAAVESPALEIAAEPSDAPAELATPSGAPIEHADAREAWAQPNVQSEDTHDAENAHDTDQETVHAYEAAPEAAPAIEARIESNAGIRAPTSSDDAEQVRDTASQSADRTDAVAELLAARDSIAGTPRAQKPTARVIDARPPMSRPAAVEHSNSFGRVQDQEKAPAARRRNDWRLWLALPVLTALAVGAWTLLDRTRDRDIRQIQTQRIAAEKPTLRPSDLPPAVPAADLPQIALFVESGNSTDSTIADDIRRIMAHQSAFNVVVRSGEPFRDSDATPRFAIVRYEALEAARSTQSKTTGNETTDRLRVVAPLYTEEIYVIVRRDAPLNYIHEIRGARINVGPQQSSRGLTATRLYRGMFDTPLAPDRMTFLDDDAALQKLVVDKTIDAMIVIAAQPARWLASLPPQVARSIKLLKLDSSSAASRKAIEIYLPVVVHAANYRSLLTDDVPTLATIAFLVTSDYTDPSAVERLQTFTRSLCQSLPTLRREGHPKWKEVQPGFEVDTGWPYSRPARAAFRSCLAEETANPSAVQPSLTRAKELGK